MRHGDIFLHGPWAHLVVQGDVQHFITCEGQGFLDHRIAFCFVEFSFHGFDQGVNAGIADFGEVEADQDLVCVS